MELGLYSVQALPISDYLELMVGWLLDLVPLLLWVLYNIVQICIGGVSFAYTQNSWLNIMYYIVHFNLLSPKNILVSIENRHINFGFHVRVIVHVKVEVVL